MEFLLSRDLDFEEAIAWFWCADYWQHDQLADFISKRIDSINPDFIYEFNSDDYVYSHDAMAAKLRQAVKGLARIADKIYKPDIATKPQLYRRCTQLLAQAFIKSGKLGLASSAFAGTPKAELLQTLTQRVAGDVLWQIAVPGSRE
jgi:hypothetical protein